MGRLYGACCPGERLELIPMIKMETRHPVEIQFDCEYVAICYHCRVMAAWSRQIWNIFEKFLRFVGKTTPYDKIFKILFGKFTSRHRLTLFCAKFVKIVRREIGEIVRYLPDQQKNIFFGSLSNCGYCTDRAESLPWPAPNLWLITFQILSKSVYL